MFPNDAKAACSVRCPVASSIKPTLGPQKGIKKPIMFEVATWRKDCSPFGSRTFVWGMFPNDAKAACSVRCPVASSIKPTCSVRKGHKKANCVRGGNLAEGLLAFRLADLCLGHVPQRCKSRLQRSMPCCILDQAYLLGPQKGIKKRIVYEVATWRKDCSPFGSRTFVWGMFPNDAKAACSVRCPVASSIKPTCSVRKRA